MTPIRCLLIDDEPPAIELLQTYAGMVDQLQVVATSHSAVKAFSLLQTQEIDLIFLDIRMPVLNGMDFIKSLQQPPAIVLTTAYREYALDGYDLDVVDYLLKPISFDRFLKAVDRYRHQRLQQTVASPSSSTLAETSYLTVKANRKHHRLPLQDIRFVEGLKDYVRVHTISKTLVVKGNLGSFLGQLPTSDFLRIHRSYVVNLRHVSAYSQSTVEIGGQDLPFGPSFREEVLRRLG